MSPLLLKRLDIHVGDVLMRWRPTALWHFAIFFFLIGLWLTAQPAGAAESAGEQTFTWGQVCILVAVAAAWGDMRAQLRDVRKEVDELKKQGE